MKRSQWILLWGTICWSSVTIGWASDAASLAVTEFMASNSKTLADGDGDYSDWIEIYNPTANTISLSDCYLTDNSKKPTKWIFPATAAISVPASRYILVYASGKGSADEPYVDSLGRIHTSFKLSGDGEDVVLLDTDGATTISSYIGYAAQKADLSYGLGANGVSGFLKTPTPGAANTDAGEGWVADPQVSVERGFYSSEFTVDLTCETPSATIRYTTDGSTPSETNGTTFDGSISITKTTPLRVMSYRSGWFPSNMRTHTYLFLANTISQASTRPTSSWPSPTTGNNSTQAMDYGMDSRVTGDSRYSDLMDDALLAVPTISIVTDLPNLFNTSTGIYANATQSGENWEREASVELINPDGSTGFQVNTGLRIRGGTSSSKTNPKHSFRIIMRSDYGDSKIEYPLMGENGPSKFDKIDLRTAQNFSWNYQSPQFCTHLDDPFSHDTMRDMGHVNTNGNFYHLYLDGVYWGLYQIEERPDAQFCKSYLEDSGDNFDVLKSSDSTGELYALDGTLDQYKAYWTLVNSGVSTIEAYERLRGLNADGIVNNSYPKYLDVDNLIDYMLIVFYTGAQDMPLGPPNQNSKPRNLYVVGNRVTPDGFKYMPHDNEWSLMQQAGLNTNRVSATLSSTLGTQKFFNPWWLHQVLKANKEYLIRFADRVHKHLFNGGALTPTACVARYQKRMDEINLAIIAESARWGDYLSSNDPRTRDDDWLPAVKWVRDTFMNGSSSNRTSVLLGQLKSAGLYPSVAAPEFSQNGGTVDSGFLLTITASAGTLYYSTDGTDPRQIGGEASPTAEQGESGLTVPLTASATVKARALSNGVWSAVTEFDFAVTAPETGIKSSWLLY